MLRSHISTLLHALKENKNIQIVLYIPALYGNIEMEQYIERIK
jgi:hypothetical protein